MTLFVLFSGHMNPRVQDLRASGSAKERSQGRREEGAGDGEETHRQQFTRRAQAPTKRRAETNEVKMLIELSEEGESSVEVGSGSDSFSSVDPSSEC